MHLIRFIIRIYHDAGSSESQTLVFACYRLLLRYKSTKCLLLDNMEWCYFKASQQTLLRKSFDLFPVISRVKVAKTLLFLE